MEKKELELTIVDLLSEKSGIGEDDIKLHMLLREDLGIDSFQAVEVIYELELIFKIKIPNEDAGTLKRVADVIDYIAGRIHGRKG